MFETKGSITESALQDIFKKMMPKWYQMMQAAPIILLFLLAAQATATHRLVNAGVYLIFAMFFLTLSRSKTRNEARRMMNRMRKITGKELPEYLTRFEDDAVYTEAVGTKAAAIIPYNSIIRQINTQHFTILFTAKNENIFVFRDQLDSEQLEQLSRFLKDKIPGLVQKNI